MLGLIIKVEMTYSQGEIGIFIKNTKASFMLGPKW